jgi:hypothetical protein
MICILSIREASIAFYVQIARSSQGTQSLNPDSDRVRKSGFNPFWLCPLLIAVRKTVCGLILDLIFKCFPLNT